MVENWFTSQIGKKPISQIQYELAEKVYNKKEELKQKEATKKKNTVKPDNSLNSLMYQGMTGASLALTRLVNPFIDLQAENTIKKYSKENNIDPDTFRQRYPYLGNTISLYSKGEKTITDAAGKTADAAAKTIKDTVDNIPMPELPELPDFGGMLDSAKWIAIAVVIVLLLIMAAFIFGNVKGAI